jgi:predicted metal-dependent hydrolase
MMTAMTEPARAGILHVGDLDVTVQVSGRRRSIRLTVERDATLTAVIPPGTDMAELTKAIKAKRQWLYGKLRERAEIGQPRPQRKYVTGEGFPYLGRSYRLLLVDDAPRAVRLNRGRLELRRDAAGDATRHLARWYRRAGEPWLRKRIAPWAQRMSVEVTALRVLPLGYRWGSCSADGKVNIHWAAMQLSPDLVDYVLVHELAHLRHHDHGPEFWQIVERAMPDYQARRDRLRSLGPDLWLPEARLCFRRSRGPRPRGPRPRGPHQRGPRGREPHRCQKAGTRRCWSWDYAVGEVTGNSRVIFLISGP